MSVFLLGNVVITAKCLEYCNENNIDASALLARHAAGHWGDLCRDDKELNETALAHKDGRLFSSYNVQSGKIWIITEWDRSSTCIMLPEDY
jgi:hypothetical protein